MKKLSLITLFVMIAITAISAQTFIQMPAIFSENMVLQQRSKVPFWGKTNPGMDITVKTSWGANARTKVQKDSLWTVKLKTPKAGGPFDVTLRIGDSVITYKNVMTGEVWICSGQSNMEMPLQGWPPKDTVWTATEEIKNATNTMIRFFSVPRTYADTKQFNCGGGKWVESTPKNAAKFSAAAYFFGEKLFKELNVPIGLVNTSWGGTPIESWIGRKYLSEINQYKPELELLAKCHSDITRQNKWIMSHPVVDLIDKDPKIKWKGLELNDADCPLISFDDSKWTEMNLPTLWESTPLGNFDGAGWFRKKVEIPSGWVNKDLVLALGPIDDMDETYVNGKKVGETMEEGNWQIDRKYPVTSSIVTDSVLTIAVRVVDNQGGGGIYGSKGRMKIYLKDSLGVAVDSLSIAGEWKFLPVAEFSNNKFYVFGAKGEEYFARPKIAVNLSAYEPTALYNSMIAPLAPYSIKGAIWYQGESNTGQPELYKTLFPMMINNWREDFQVGKFPFYFVQIAPYNYGPATRSERLREAQMQTLSVPKTGMAVTLDIGNVNNIHPGNKKDVGERLALWALAKDYNKKVVYSGPVYKSMKTEKGKIILTFDHADGGLFIKERNGENNFLIAGSNGRFEKAEAKVNGKTLTVSSPLVQDPKYVRYAWSNVSEATLFNKFDLPASSFRTDSLTEEQITMKK